MFKNILLLVVSLLIFLPVQAIKQMLHPKKLLFLMVQ